jgi:hypothetical protein
VITSHPRCTADRGRSALPKTATQRETGNRKIGRGISFGSQVSAIRCLVRVFRFRCRFRKSVVGHLTSMQSSSRVAGGGPGWRVAGSIHSALNAALHSALHSEHSYVVTRSRPYPWQTRAARGAAPTPRQALPLYSILHTRYSQHSAPLSDSAVGTPFSPHPQFCLELPRPPAI